MNPSPDIPRGFDPARYGPLLAGVRSNTARIARKKPQQLRSMDLAEIVASAAAFMDEQLSRMGEAARQHFGKAPACRAGCSMCCHQTIHISVSELALIAAAIHRDSAGSVLAACSATAQRVAGLSHAERYRAGIPCALLEEDRCGAYRYRPSPCRTHFSLSMEACLDDWARRNDPDSPQGTGIPFLQEPKFFGAMVQMGVDLVLMQRGLLMVKVEIAHGIEALLSPGGLDRWLRGGDPFTLVPPDMIDRTYADNLRGALDLAEKYQR